MKLSHKKYNDLNHKFYEFIDILKDANVSISTDELLSLFSALKEIEISDKLIFKQTLKTTLIKEYTDIPVFDKCFSEYFEGIENLEDQIVSIDKLQDNNNLSDNDIHNLEDMMDTFIEEISENLLFEKTPEDLLSLFLDEIEGEGSSGGMGMMLFQAKRSLMQSYSGRPGEGEEDGEGAEIADLLLEMLSQRVGKRKIGKEIKNREDFLFNKFIYQLTPDEIKEMREMVNRFGQKLKNRISLRKKKVKHGGIDIKKTFRTSLSYGGIPFKIFYKNRKIDRPQIVVLCDVSGSVNQYTRFMLLLTHTLQSLFGKVRTFAFISNMVEITPLFREMDPERAINSIFEDTNFTYGWGSHYGQCFDQFMINHSDALNKKTTVLVLGDARNNNQDPGLESFLKIKEKSKNLFWLNPDKKHLWNWSDSIATLYEQYCTDMKEVNSFLDLSEFIDKIFVQV